jgi:hypothetical protein
VDDLILRISRNAIVGNGELSSPADDELAYKSASRASTAIAGAASSATSIADHN